LRADINLFYSSIYTHSVPWALHTKILAKAQQRDTGLKGNELDRLLRNLNDKQTIGIPIGPDVSLLVAEILLSSVDIGFGTGRLTSGARYLDDYEFSFSTLAETEQGLADLQGALAEFELTLNPAKCAIEELPRPLEAPWVAELRSFRLADKSRKQGNDLISFFTKAFVVARMYPQEPVLKYAIGRVAALKVAPSNFSLYQSLLLQTASGEAGALPAVIAELAKYSAAGAAIDEQALSSTFSAVVLVHAPMAHGSDVAWALWGALRLGVALDSAVEPVLSRMTDSIVAILALDAKGRGVLSSALDTSAWDNLTSGPTDVLGPHWLLAYEAGLRGWLPSAASTSLAKVSPYFAALKNAGVSFYDSGRAPLTPRTSSAPSTTGASGSVKIEDFDWDEYGASKAELDDDGKDEGYG